MQGDKRMFYQLIVVYLLAPLLLHNSKKQETLKELFKTRKNVFQRFLDFIDEMNFEEDQIILEHSGAYTSVLQRGRARIEEEKGEKFKIIEAKNECRKAKIPEWMIRSLILEYDDLLKFEKSSFLF